MKLQEIREMAKQRGIKAGKMKKEDLIKTIQTHEGNTACFASIYAETCGQDQCLWRRDCAAAGQPGAFSSVR